MIELTKEEVRYVPTNLGDGEALSALAIMLAEHSTTSNDRGIIRLLSREGVSPALMRRLCMTTRATCIAAAGNPTATSEVLHYIMENCKDTWSVNNHALLNVANNPNTARDTLLILVGNKRNDISAAARRRLQEME